MAAPAETEYHGVCVRYLRPKSSMDPQEGVGGCTPRPRNDSAASVRIALANATEHCTRIGESVLGSSTRSIRCALVAPAAREASTNSVSLRDSKLPRVMRANDGIV